MAKPMANRDIRRARLYDLRSAIAALFTAFGVIVTLTGLFSDEADLVKSQGINVSLWTGLGMLLLAGCFWIWLFVVPPDVPTGHSATDFEPLNLILRVRYHPIRGRNTATSWAFFEKLRATFAQVLAQGTTRTSLLLRALVGGPDEPQVEVHGGRRGYFPHLVCKGWNAPVYDAVRRAVRCHVGLT